MDSGEKRYLIFKGKWTAPVYEEDPAKCIYILKHYYIIGIYYSNISNELTNVQLIVRNLEIIQYGRDVVYFTGLWYKNMDFRF